MRLSTGPCTEDIWSSMSLNQSSLSFTVRFLFALEGLCTNLSYNLFCHMERISHPNVPTDSRGLTQHYLHVNRSFLGSSLGPVASFRNPFWKPCNCYLPRQSQRKLEVLVFSFISYFCRLLSRCTVAFEENHRSQELRVPHIEAGGVSGVPSGRYMNGQKRLLWRLKIPNYISWKMFASNINYVNWQKNN